MPAFITLDIDPLAVVAGPVALRWYGLMISAALVAGVLLALREASRRGLPEGDILYLALWSIPFGLAGARLMHVLDGWQYYATYPLQILAFQEGGLSLYGGLLGGLLAGLWAARRRRLPWRRLLDVAVPGLLVGQALGRAGCFLNGDHQGLPSGLPWATSYVHAGSMAPDSLPRHPAQLYDLMYVLAVLGLLLLLRPRLEREGMLFALYAALHSFGSFWIAALRLDPPFLLGLKQAQLLAAAVFLASVVAGVALWRQGPVGRRAVSMKTVGAEGAPPAPRE